MSRLKVVYEATQAIPGLGAERGDQIVVQPDHPQAPLLVVKRHDSEDLPAILDNLERLTVVSGHPDEVIEGVRALRRSHLRLVTSLGQRHG